MNITAMLTGWAKTFNYGGQELEKTPAKEK